MKNIIFDFGGVLLTWNPDNFYLSHFNDDKKLMQNFYDETKIQILNLEMDRGTSHDFILRDLIKEFPHYEKPLLAWKTCWHKMLSGTVEGSVEILKQLNDSGYQLYGLTNWSAETFPYVYYTHDFFQLFKDIVVSGRVNLIKPDPQIYKICLERNNLIPEETIFIDDNLNNVETAKNLGLHGIHFTNASQLHTSLINLGIEI